MFELILALVAVMAQLQPSPAGVASPRLASLPSVIASASVEPTPPPTTTLPPTIPTPTPEPTPTVTRRVVNGKVYDAYLDAAAKNGQWFQYTCEFDAAWIVLKTFGHDVSLAKQAELVTLDKKGPEPYYKETAQGVMIYGGDIFSSYSGDYKKNFLARSTGQAMTKLFKHYGLRVTPVNDRAGIEAALLRGEIIWIKTTVDFKDWVPATWVLPDGTTYKTVLGNDHSNVVIGFNKDVVVIRDPLGPTSTGRDRPLTYEVSWAKFLRAWGAQQYDGLAVGK